MPLRVDFVRISKSRFREDFQDCLQIDVDEEGVKGHLLTNADEGA